MGVIHDIMDYQQLINAMQATGTFDSVAQAVESGAVMEAGGALITPFQSINGGKGMPVISYDDALQVAKQAQALGATAATIYTAAGVLAKSAVEAGKYTLVGACTLELPAAVAMCAPLAGVALGEGLYNENPSLWNKISQAMIPFCYAENKIHAYLEYYLDPTTGRYNPVMCLATGIIDTLRSLFESEHVNPHESMEIRSPYGTATLVTMADTIPFRAVPGAPPYIKTSGNGMAAATPYSDAYAVYCTEHTSWKSNYYGGTYKDIWAGWTTGLSAQDIADLGIPIISNLGQIISGATSEEVIPPTAGTIAPEIEPWTFPGFSPDCPLIIVEPGGEPEELPVTPVTPLLPGTVPGTTPLLPEHVPDPTPDKPDSWPEEEPWPSVVPFPWTDPVPSTEPGPNPDWPEVMPWPLPEDPPDEWPKIPEEWPYPFPEEVPWPKNPNLWPDEVPWPATPPDWWPDGTPWPETPEEWPEEVPWPVPWPEEWPTYPPTWPEPFPEELPWPSKPEDWPIEVPWPVNPPDWWPDGEPWPVDPESWPDDVPWPLPPSWPIPWPPTYPYPYPYPYPTPSPNPYPDPTKIEDPEQQVDPYIDPWPYPFPDPYPDPTPDPTRDPIPDPFRDPSQPEPDPDPLPEPGPEPDKPYPTPPSGTPTPPIPPIIPLPFSSTTGLISVYHPTQSELLSFAQWLWVTWQDATIDKIWNNPFDGVITLFELYCTPTDVGRKNIRSGFLDSGVSSETISRYTSIDCGSIAVPEYFGNYLDYAPYSKCHIYLPFIGIVELNVDDVVGHGVNVTYRIDEYNGSCIAMITCAKSTTVNGTEVDYSTVMYQFSGNCAVELPLSGGSQAAIRSGMIEAAAWGIGSVIGGVMSGNSMGEIGANMAYGVASAVHSVVSAKSSVQHSGSFGSSYGAMGAKIPYIIITRPKQIQVPNYNAHYGYQAHKMVRVGDCTGYIRCREVHVISPTASDEEKAQIEQLMKMGVYVTE